LVDDNCRQLSTAESVHKQSYNDSVFLILTGYNWLIY